MIMMMTTMMIIMIIIIILAVDSIQIDCSFPIPVAARSKAYVCCRSPAETVGSNLIGVMDVCCDCRMLSGRDLCDEPITRPGESYRVWCAVVCDLQASKIRRPWPDMGRSDTRKILFIIASLADFLLPCFFPPVIP